MDSGTVRLDHLGRCLRKDGGNRCQGRCPPARRTITHVCQWPESFAEVESVGQAEDGGLWGAILSMPTLLPPLTAPPYISDPRVARGACTS